MAIASPLWCYFVLAEANPRETSIGFSPSPSVSQVNEYVKKLVAIAIANPSWCHSDEDKSRETRRDAPPLTWISQVTNTCLCIYIHLCLRLISIYPSINTWYSSLERVILLHKSHFYVLTFFNSIMGCLFYPLNDRKWMC
jgi:hypothetical protein